MIRSYIRRFLFGSSMVIFSSGGFPNGKLVGKPEQIGDFSIVIYGGNVIFGENVKVGYGVKIISASTINAQSNQPILKTIKIGHNVEIGSNAVILPGVEIGDNTVIGAGAVVTQTIPPNSVAVGVPAKIIKSINKYNK